MHLNRKSTSVMLRTIIDLATYLLVLPGTCAHFMFLVFHTKNIDYASERQDTSSLGWMCAAIYCTFNKTIRLTVSKVLPIHTYAILFPKSSMIQDNRNKKNEEM